ncbi:MAG TPA: hypothetical protein VMI09_13250 [Candidatus Binataceae bacterium]|nr:hypothetical protein [Candidatus Binataceae bacterium]
MKRGAIAPGRMGQAMTEFLFIAFVTFIILFVAIQMAAIGREYMALGQLNYQVARWATSPTNNALKDTSGNPVNSPQCADVATLIKGNSVSPYSSVSGIASGYMGKIGFGNTNCGSPPPGGIGVAMNCVAAGGKTSTPCAAQRAPGTEVQITLTMDTSPILFLTTSKTNPNFLGIPFPKTLSSEQTMLTQ